MKPLKALTISSVVVLAGLLATINTGTASADEPAIGPLRAATPSPAEQKAYIEFLLKNLDPCAGPLEVQNKTSITPCVFVAGEAAFSYGYASVDVPGRVEARAVGGATASRDFFGHIVAYPSFTMEIGVTKHSQVSIIAPSAIDTNVRTGNAASGGSDLQLSYKHMVFANLKSATLLSLAGIYEPPTGSAPFAAPGPAYNLQAIIGQGLPKHFGITAELPLAYGVASTNQQGKNRYGFSFAPTLLPYWQSPGGTLLAVAATHTFSPSLTPLTVSALQMIDRHVQIGLAYGGVNAFTDVAGPIPQVLRFNTSAYPRLLSVNLYFLVGQSDVPPALLQLEQAQRLKTQPAH